MLFVPIADTYSQTVRVSLGGQDCTVELRQRSTGLYCSVYVSDALIIGGVLCLDRVGIVQSHYLGFVGDLAFADIQGTKDPSSPGLGTRFLLCYLEASDLAA